MSRITPASILEASPPAAATLAASRAVSGWSQSAQRLLGWTKNQIVGRDLSAWIAPSHLESLRRALDKLENGRTVEQFAIEAITSGGQRERVEISLLATRETGRFTGTLLLMRDIEARTRAERDLLDAQERTARRTLILAAANRVALDILGSQSGLEALRHIAEAARVLGRARYAALGVARRDGPGFQEFIVVGLSPAQQARMSPLPSSVGVLGSLLKRETPLRLRDLSEYPHSAGFPDYHPPMNAFLGVPIRRGAQALGSLYLAEKIEADEFTESDETAVSALGAHAAVAIHNLHMLARQRALVSGFIRAQEDERRAIAYDLHDGLTQYVMASCAHLEASQRAHKRGDAAKSERELEHCARYLRESVVESRRLINGLRLLALEDLGLAGALEQLLRDEATRAKWKTELRSNLEQRRFDSSLEIGVYRIAQEALTNARKHAESARVEVTLWADDEAEPPVLQLEVRDWGEGFALDSAHEEDDINHVGLHGMRERVEMLGGTLEVQSETGQGTSVRAQLPIIEATPIAATSP